MQRVRPDVDSYAVQRVLDDWDAFLRPSQGGQRSIYHDTFRGFLRRQDVVESVGLSLRGERHHRRRPLGVREPAGRPVVTSAAVNWGSAPDWIAGVGSVIATLLAVIGLLYEVRKRRIADADTKAASRAAEANQARLVSVDVRVRGNGRRSKFIVRNDSSAPIRTLSPLLYWAESGARWQMPRLADGTPMAVLGPHELVETLAEVAVGEPEPPGRGAVRGAVAFTDAEGRRWLCLADAASPVAVLGDDRRALQLEVDRS